MFAAHTKDTMSDIYLDALKIRQEVFVKEQNISESLEVDQNEARTIHFVLYQDSKQPVATLRLLPYEAGTFKIQRMAVRKAFRKQGLGKILMRAAEEFAIEQNFQKLILGAQVSAIPFYESLGYQTEGEKFIDADIKHINMFKIVPTKA